MTKPDKLNCLILQLDLNLSKGKYNNQRSFIFNIINSVKIKMNIVNDLITFGEPSHQNN
jgi:hypothetical protein